jgi:hypothetical protein
MRSDLELKSIIGDDLRLYMYVMPFSRRYTFHELTHVADVCSKLFNLKGRDVINLLFQIRKEGMR